MKKNVAFKFIFVCVSLLAFSFVRSQSCIPLSSFHDPHGFAITSSQYPAGVSVIAGTANTVPVVNCGDGHLYFFNACTATSSTTGSYYTYRFNVGSSNTSVWGYLVTVNGGYVNAETLHYLSGSTVSSPGDISPNTYPYPGTTPAQNGAIGGSGPVSYVDVTVRWTSASATNNLSFYGYHVSCAGCTDYSLAAFAGITANTSNFPTAPPAVGQILLGSPACSVPGWVVDPINQGSSAPQYNWGYNGAPNMGGQMGIYPNAQHPYAPGPVIPNPNSYAVTVNLYVYAMSLGNSCAVAQSSNPTYGSVSILSAQQACSRGYQANPQIRNGQVDNSDNNVMMKNDVFPIPAEGNITVSFDKIANHTVEIVSMLGRVHRHIQEINSDRIHVDVSNLPKGVYIVVVYEDKTPVWRRKIVL